MVDERFELIQLDVRLTAGGLVVHGELGAFVRRAATALRPQRLDGVLPPPGALSGRRALVVGASRGLGAALALALARAGAHVTATYAVSADAAQALERAAADASGPLHVRRVDASEAAQCDALCAALEGEGGIDLLILCAAPPLLPLELSPGTRARFDAFVAESLRMMSAPLLSALSGLAQRDGTVVVLSSSAVEAPPDEWPHYVTAKAAVEGLARAAAVAQPRVGVMIVRPPRLQTDLTNTVRGHALARTPEEVAAAIVRRIHQGIGTGVTMFGGADDAALTAVTE